MGLKSAFYWFVVISVADTLTTDGPKTLPSILWHPKNYLFACNENRNLTINVRLKDIIDFVCPFLDEYETSIITESLPFLLEYYEHIYLVDEEGYVNCDTTNGIQFLKCETPALLKIKMEKFESIFKYNRMVNNTYNRKYEAGKDYYLITTSSGEKAGIGQKKGGLCIPTADNYAMKLILHVCEDDSEACVCQHASCYEQQCGVWNKWRETQTFYWNGTTCLQKYTRECNTTTFKCEGERTKFVQAASKEECKLPCTTQRPVTPVTPNCTITPYSHVTKEKYNITVITAILTALITGLFVMHAFMCYYEGMRIEGRVYRESANYERLSSASCADSISKKDGGSIYSNGTVQKNAADDVDYNDDRSRKITNATTEEDAGSFRERQQSHNGSQRSDKRSVRSEQQQQEERISNASDRVSESNTRRSFASDREQRQSNASCREPRGSQASRSISGHRSHANPAYDDNEDIHNGRERSDKEEDAVRKESKKDFANYGQPIYTSIN